MGPVKSYRRAILAFVCVGFGIYLFLNITQINATRKQYPKLDCVEEKKKVEKELRRDKWKFVESMLLKENKKKRLPSIIGIGVEKCGTHAFAQFLWPHPMIKNRVPIEAHFFESGAKNLVEYIDSMPESEDIALTMEKTPAYFSFPPSHIPRLIKTYAPNAKLVLILCDPSKRVISDYAQELIMGSIKKERYPTVQDYLRNYMPKVNKFQNYQANDEHELKQLSDELLKLHSMDYPSTILTTGLYALHLSRWLQYYNSSNLFIVNGDELMNFPGRVIERVQDFLDVPKLLLQEDYVRDPETGFYCFQHPITNELSCMFAGKMRTRNGMTEYPTETMQELRSFYKSSNEHLYRLIGQRFAW